MSSAHELPFALRWIVFPFLIFVLAILILFEGATMVDALRARLFWTPTIAHLTQTVREGKGMLGEYRYVFGGKEYSGVEFGGPITAQSKVGDEIRVWVNPDEPVMSMIPRSLWMIPFLCLLSIAEAASIWALVTNGKMKNQFEKASSL